MFKTTLFLALVACASATTELNSETFEDGIAGKGAFVKFFAPWCGHCKKIKPAWDQLAETFEGNDNVAIVDVDCTKDDSKDLCTKYGVRGYPTIKYITDSTDPMGDKYEGGRDFDALKAFADENLGPSCSPKNLDLCDDDQKAEIAKYSAMTEAELQEMVDASTKAVADAEALFKTEVEKLQKTYEKLSKDKDEAVAAASTPELRYVKQVLGHMKSSADAKDEL
eukprot:m.119777 g.119777  ORF g.119777 m.119777 type:complete len:224 (+) comp11036_c0_seq3:413-1084(+)